MALKWEGDDLKRRMQAAAKEGIDATMALAVIHAKQNHPWRNRTATLEGSINIYQFAQQEGDRVVGKWGSADVNYALALELGAQPHEIPNAFGKGVTVQHPGNRPFPFLRPAADATYGRLAELIQRAFRRA